MKEKSILNNSITEENYCIFRYHSSIVEGEYKPNTECKNKFILLGDTICDERENFRYIQKKQLRKQIYFYIRLKRD